LKGSKNVNIKHISLNFSETAKILTQRKNHPDLPIPSLRTLNEKLHGLPKGKMLTIGARTSMGKTAFVLQLVNDLLDSNKRVLYMSFEMTAEEVLERLFCRKYKISNIDLLKGNFELHRTDWALFQDYLSNVQFVFSSDFGKTWEEIDKFISQLEEKPDAVIIDYIQAIGGSSTPLMKGFIDEYIRHFKQLASENGFCGILVSQLNRTNPDNKDKSPQLHQLQGSSHLENHSDCVILLDWICKHTETDDKSAYIVNIAKNRNGRTGYIKMKFNPEYYTFTEDIPETPYQHAMEELNAKGW